MWSSGPKPSKAVHVMEQNETFIKTPLKPTRQNRRGTKPQGHIAASPWYYWTRPASDRQEKRGEILQKIDEENLPIRQKHKSEKSNNISDEPFLWFFFKYAFFLMQSSLWYFVPDFCLSSDVVVAFLYAYLHFHLEVCSASLFIARHNCGASFKDPYFLQEFCTPDILVPTDSKSF